jgi:hypothetical protein
LTDAQLLAAILANPTALSQANAGNDSGCAATLEATLPPVVAPLPISLLNVWAASRGVLVAVLANTSNGNAQIASACLGVQAALQGGASSLDLTDPAVLSLLAGLTSAGILPANTAGSGSTPTLGSEADLLAFGSVPQIIDHTQVSRVCAPYRTNGSPGAIS